MLAWKDTRRTYNKCLVTKKHSFWCKYLQDNKTNSKQLWTGICKLIGQQPSSSPKHPDGVGLCQEFADAFLGKINTIRTTITKTPQPEHSYKSPCPMSAFKVLDESEILRVLHSSANKQCQLDSIPTWLLKHISPIIIKTITKFAISLFPLAISPLNTSMQ